VFLQDYLAFGAAQKGIPNGHLPRRNLHGIAKQFGMVLTALLARTPIRGGVRRGAVLLKSAG